MKKTVYARVTSNLFAEEAYSKEISCKHSETRSETKRNLLLLVEQSFFTIKSTCANVVVMMTILLLTASVMGKKSYWCEEMGNHLAADYLWRQ